MVKISNNHKKRKLKNQKPLLTIFTECDYSPIQSLIINGRFPFDSFGNLLCCLPKLQHLSIDCLVQDRYYTEEEEEKLSLIQLKCLKYVSLRIDYVEFKTRKDYVYYWESNEPICSQIQKENYHLVKHFYICSKKIKDNYLSYFSNVNQLTVKHHFETSNDSIPTTLHRMIPLKQLTKLVIEYYKFSFIEIIQFLHFTPNLYALKLDYLPFSHLSFNVIKPNEVFQYVSNRNKIKILDFRVWCSSNEIQLVVNLFPQV
ncbi:unnamed protein product [Rotaria sp. Silwood1]|nr:unnamed protein product [Rotaria sp. Silwood1]